MGTKKKICMIVILQQNGSVLLGHPVNGPAKGKLNFPGGKLEEGELPRECAVREIWEELRLRIREEALRERGMVTFVWQTEAPRMGEPEIKEVEAHIYLLDTWTGEPQATPDLPDPVWYPVSAIPYGEMMPGDRLWLPRALAEGNNLASRIHYGPNGELLDHEL